MRDTVRSTLRDMVQVHTLQVHTVQVHTALLPKRDPVWWCQIRDRAASFFFSQRRANSLMLTLMCLCHVSRLLPAGGLLLIAEQLERLEEPKEQHLGVTVEREDDEKDLQPHTHGWTPILCDGRSRSIHLVILVWFLHVRTVFLFTERVPAGYRKPGFVYFIPNNQRMMLTTAENRSSLLTRGNSCETRPSGGSLAPKPRAGNILSLS